MGVGDEDSNGTVIHASADGYINSCGGQMHFDELSRQVGDAEA